MPPVIKTTMRNGRTLVHRVEKENTDVLVPTQPDVMLLLILWSFYTSDVIYRVSITPTFLCQGQIRNLSGGFWVRPPSRK